MKCLIVDDDNFVQLIHKEILAPVFDCDIASNGEEAVQLFTKATGDNAPYDLICMDVEMPVCDGHEALKKIREIEKKCEIAPSKQVKIIMLSSHDDPKLVLESYYKGGTSYIVKPVDPKKLMQILKNFKLVPY